jgi:hypothetical protein
MKTALNFKINGISQTRKQGVSREEALKAFDQVLRAIALSDSPVLVEGGSPINRTQIAERLHILGRRSEQPFRICSTVRECKKLLSGDVGGASWEKRLGTWALRGVTAWSLDRQQELSALLERLDEQRFSSGVKHDKAPRVIVLLGEDEAPAELTPQLQKRLSFFHIALSGASLEAAR